MTCYHPLKGFIIGTNPETGKKKLKIMPYDVEEIPNPNWYASKTEFVPLFINDFVPIPCGQCIGCRIDYSKQWATRCMLESSYHKENYFLTLTYNDDTVLHTGYIDSKGDFQDTLSLYKKDLQDFNKRLRINLVRKKKKLLESGVSVDWSPEFRFYACGEYGSKTARPHYHMIAFGLHLDDLVFYKSTPYGNLYTSDFLKDTWKNGHVIVGGVAYESCAYVSRYIMKKQKGLNSSVYEEYNIAPEFTLMSRRPGIANDYFMDNYDDIYPNDKIVLPGGKLSKPPRYFDSLMNDIDEELMEDIKLKRADIAQSIQSYKDTLTTADFLKQLEYAENNKESQCAKLVRPLE